MKYEVRIKPYLTIGLHDTWFKVQYKRTYIQIGGFRFYRWITVADCHTCFTAESIANAVLRCMNGDWLESKGEH